LACGCGNCEIDNEFEIISHSLTNTKKKKKKTSFPMSLKMGAKMTQVPKS
jgi:hypothetical protein